MSFALPQDRRTNQNLSNYRLIYFAQDGANRHFFITELYNLTNCYPNPSLTPLPFQLFELFSARVGVKNVVTTLERKVRLGELLH